MRVTSNLSVCSSSKSRQRLAVSVYFFIAGLSFSSWASRIPTIKSNLDINDAELGTLLFTMPIAQLVGLPLSSWLATKFDTRKPLAVGMLLHGLSLWLIGISDTRFSLVLAMFSFAFFMRILNISLNAQAINLQKQFDKKINGSFHGLWSMGGIAGIGLSTLAVAFEISIETHLLAVALLVMVASLLEYPWLIKKDRSTSGNKIGFRKPDKQLFLLGIMVFFASICEGGMFDWSGVYFKEVVKVEIFTSGYLVFMASMALSRFVSDYFIRELGMGKTYIFSALLMALGLTMAVLFPTFEVAMIGFSMAGFGTAAIFPMTFTLTGTSKKYSTGMAISIVITYAMAGMLLGPVLLGYIAHAIHLKASFVFLTLAGLTLIPLSRIYFKHFDGKS